MLTKLVQALAAGAFLLGMNSCESKAIDACSCEIGQASTEVCPNITNDISEKDSAEELMNIEKLVNDEIQPDSKSETAPYATSADLKNYPIFFTDEGCVFNGYLVVGADADSMDNLAMTDIAVGMKCLVAESCSDQTCTKVYNPVIIIDAVRLDTEIADITAQNLIVIGNSCTNFIARDLLGNPKDCTEGYTPGKAKIQLFEPAPGIYSMLVAGYSSADTRLAGMVIAHRWEELSGTEVEIEGTTYSDAKITFK